MANEIGMAAINKAVYLILKAADYGLVPHSHISFIDFEQVVIEEINDFVDVITEYAAEQPDTAELIKQVLQEEFTEGTIMERYSCEDYLSQMRNLLSAYGETSVPFYDWVVEAIDAGIKTEEV